MDARMAKRRVQDPGTGKIRWIDDGAESPPSTPAAKPGETAAPTKPRARRARAPSAPTSAPRRERSEWERLFDGMQDSAADAGS